MRMTGPSRHMIIAVLFSCLLLLGMRDFTHAQVNSDESLEEDKVAGEKLGSNPVTRYMGSVPFRYHRKGRRDPFIPLMNTEGDETIPSVASLKLTGVIWNHGESLAVLEDSKGVGYPMRVGDRLGNATLIGIKENSVVFRVVLYGEVHMHTLWLESKEEMRR
ncbi:MAG: hypothetical protein ACE5OP_10620 [Candidatus Glassbacteria bacterium]